MKSLAFFIGDPLNVTLSIKSIGRGNLSFLHFSTSSTFFAPESQGGNACHVTTLDAANPTC